MSDRLRHVLRALSAPWAITPEGFETVCAIIDRRVAGVRLTDTEIAELVAESRDVFNRRHEAAVGIGRPGGNSVAVIPIYGTILPRPVLNLSGGGGTSLTTFMDKFRDADADPTVGQILLDVDSPGGSADLVPEAAAMIAGASKPVTAIANTTAGSAAYWLASQADELVVTPSGMVGSIGVFSRHVDMSDALAMDGVKVTLIAAGRYKVDGNPYEPLSDSALAYYQATVDEFYGMFVNAVARGRGVTPDDVSGGMGEGRMLTADAAVAAGMADRVATFAQVCEQMLGTSTSGGYRAESGTDFLLARVAHLDNQIPTAHVIDGAQQDSSATAKRHDGADNTVTFAPHAERLLARREFREANSTGR